jgi:nickel transport protein
MDHHAAGIYVTGATRLLRSIIGWARVSIVLLGGLAFSSPAFAHTIWLVPETGVPGDWHALFGGHAGKVDAYPPQKLKAVVAVSADGTPCKVTRRVASDGVHLRVAGKPSLILAYYDNGIHTRRSDGPSVEKPMHEVPTAISATRAIKYHKTIAAWTPLVIKPVGQPFEVVPLAAAQPVAGKPMKVRVLIGGKPAAGIKVSRNEEGDDAVTDGQGIASFVPAQGYNKLWSGKRTEVKGNRAYTQDSVEYSLGFFAK